jgi:predicted AAA+ superfamily ATPase
MSFDSAQTDFLSGSLPPKLVEDISDQNPWWSGKPMPLQPAFKRWPFPILLRRLEREPPLARINVLRGPRQIGKTTLQYQIIEHLLASGVSPKRILRVQFDELKSLLALRSNEPILDIARWYSRKVLAKDFNQAARDGERAYLFLDEVQNLSDWDVQLKAFVDRTDVRILVTGSSALRIELGRDSLAGRIQTLEVGPFRLSEIASVRGFGTLSPFAQPNGTAQWANRQFWLDLAAYGVTHSKLLDQTFAAFSARGGYPLAQRADVEWPEVARLLNETVVKRVIQHDLRVGERGRRRDPQLLEEVFRMAARYCGQAPNLTELARQARESMEANAGVNRIRAYVQFLDSSLLIRAIEPHEMRLKQRRGAPKFCLSDHVLRAAWLDEIVPLDSEGLKNAPEQSVLAGRIAESAVGYFFASLGLSVHYLPARAQTQEVDFVLTAGDHRIPIEVKYQARIDPIADTKGLVQFVSKSVNRASVGVLITREPVIGPLPENIVAVPLKSLLLVH